jgi:hypothetical protein
MSSLVSGDPEARDNQSADMGNHNTNPKERWGTPRLRTLGTNRGTKKDLNPQEFGTSSAGPS